MTPDKVLIPQQNQKVCNNVNTWQSGILMTLHFIIHYEMYTMGYETINNLVFR